MPETVHVGAEIPPEIRDAADKVFYDFGVTISEAICLMISRTVRDKCPPFDIKAALKEAYGDKIPNRETLESFEAVERGEVYHAKDIDAFFRCSCRMTPSYCCAPTMRV